MVVQRLREMEETGLVTREVVSDRPIAVTYTITEFGKTALSFLEELKNWVENTRFRLLYSPNTPMVEQVETVRLENQSLRELLVK